MTAEDRTGWWDAPASDTWTCPECGVSSPVEQWAERRVGCPDDGDCGDHDGRECPACTEVFDHVFGASPILKASTTAPI
ncbi:hypothetical protein ACGFIW_01260 [Micromonospora sp. NPDC048935]|uniref:hypothetical protein n=1 Tax=Micromonospora sp. NPDC048935 TaxID=3364262 RepID=UPI003723D97C